MTDYWFKKMKIIKHARWSSSIIFIAKMQNIHFFVIRKQINCDKSPLTYTYVDICQIWASNKKSQGKAENDADPNL